MNPPAIPVSAEPEELREQLWERRLRREKEIADEGLPLEERLIRLGLHVGLRLVGLYRRGRRNANTPVLRELELRFPRLPEPFDGFTLLHVSDFHFDGRPGYLDAMIHLLGSVEPDVFLFTGDYRFECFGPVDEPVRAMKRLFPVLRSRHGVFASLGNHDPSDIVEPYREIGIQWLINEHTFIQKEGERLWLLGVDENRYLKCHSLPAATEGVPEDAFRILLAHSPEIHREAAAAGIDLCLSGHTHAGQIRFPLIGAVARNDHSPRQFLAGHWTLGATQGYTTAGIGSTSVPVRFLCPPEAVLIRLRRSS